MVELRRIVGALQADRTPAELRDHGAACCAIARTWLECLDASFQRGPAAGAPPAWIAHRWTWGVTARPLFWCQIPGVGSLDCAASAALGRELWARRSPGIRAVQLIEHDAAGRTHRDRDGPSAGWAGGVLAYHEAIGREQAGRLEIWSPIDSAWLSPLPARGATRILSLRVPDQESSPLAWGRHRLTAGAWATLGREPPQPPQPSEAPEPAAAAQAPNAACAASAPVPARSQNP